MQLLTRRLRLREIEEADWRVVLRYQQDPLYLRYSPWVERTETDVRGFIGMFIRWRMELPRYRFQVGITLRDSGQLIGNCGIRSSPTRPRQAELGYELDSRFWNQGYATEAASAMLDFAFNELRLHRVQADCVAENVGSARVMQKLGMRFEGRLYEAEEMQDRWWDTLIYAILDREWLARAGQQA